MASLSAVWLCTPNSTVTSLWLGKQFSYLSIKLQKKVAGRFLGFGSMVAATPHRAAYRCTVIKHTPSLIASRCTMKERYGWLRV